MELVSTCRAIISNVYSFEIKCPEGMHFTTTDVLIQIVLFILVCARFAQLVRSLTTNQKAPGSIPGLVKG